MEPVFIQASSCLDALEKCGKKAGDLLQVTKIEATPNPYSRDVFRVDCVIEPINPWQPIETAPKDGTRIMACNKYGTIELVTWDAGRPDGTMWNAGWLIYVDGQSGFNHYEALSNPTHWMPLPKLPTN